MGQELEKSILRAATTLFARRGFAAVGVRAIAKKAQASIGAIYHHFGGKREILEAVLRREINVRKQYLETIRSQNLTFQDQVLQFMLMHFTLLKKEPDAAKIYYQERFSSGSLLRATMQGFYEEVVAYATDLVRQAMISGEVSPCNPAVVAHAFLGMVEALSYRALENDETAALISEKGPAELAVLLSAWLRSGREGVERNA